MLIQLMVSYNFLRLCSLFFILFSSCSSDLIISIVLSSSSLILSSACSNLSLYPFRKFFISVIIFSPRISFWFLSRFSNSSLTFAFVHILFSWLSPQLSSVLWASLRKLPSGLTLGQFLLVYFFLLNGPYFPDFVFVFGMACEFFCWKLDIHI